MSLVCWDTRYHLEILINKHIVSDNKRNPWQSAGISSPGCSHRRREMCRLRRHSVGRRERLPLCGWIIVALSRVRGAEAGFADRASREWNMRRDKDEGGRRKGHRMLG